MKNYIIIGLFFLALTSCKEERKFEWTKDLEQIVEPNLKDWLKKSPFTGLWNEQKNDGDKIVFDNRDQVFPFMANFKNENNNFQYSPERDKFYQQEALLFKDNKFGESFVYGALLFEPEELFISKSYSEMGSVVFSGQNAINERYYAELAETMISNKNNNYKTAIYWVRSNSKTFLFGFYQKGKLIFQFGFPCSEEEKDKGLNKIKEINQKLNLNIKEWNNATQEDLTINKNPKSFWRDPFLGIYMGEYDLPDIQLKIKNTDFKSLPKEIVERENKDYIFAQGNGDQQSSISFKREKTEATKQKFEDKLEDKPQILTNTGEKLFITQEDLVNNQKSMQMEVYTKNKSFVTVEISFPHENLKVKEQLFDILKNLKIRKF